MAGGSGTGVETVGREVVLERGGGAGLVTREWTKNSVTFERLGRWHDREGKRRGEGGGSGRGVATQRGGDRGAWPRTGRDPDVAHAGGASLFGQRHAGTDGRASMAVRAGRERSCARSRVGRPEKKRCG
jgi:hypothetical protein